MTEPIKVNARVVTWERTGTMFPSEWQGKLADGRAIYIRYRHGSFGFGIGPSLGEAVENYRHGMSHSYGGFGGAFLKDSQMIEEMRKFGVSFENAEGIGPPCEEYV